MAVDDLHPQYNKYSGQWKRLRDTIEGQDAVHAAATAYLPKLSGQDAKEYQAYVDRALFYGATGRTVDGLSGMVFRKSPVIELPATLETVRENITLDGLSLLGFAEQIVDDAIGVGRCGILVDHPNIANVDGELTVKDAEELNLRPFMKHYTAESIRNWKTRGVRNARVLQEVRLMEVVEVQSEDDEFETSTKKQIRVLDIDEAGFYRQRLYEEKENQSKNSVKEWVQVGEDMYPMMNGEKMSFIPFVFVGVKNTSPDVDKPPLIDLADANLSHYRSTADLEHGAHYTALPTAVITGLNDAEGDETPVYRIGSASAWIFSNPEAKVQFLEFTGQGLSALEQRVQAKEQYMAALGARMLQAENKGVEAAETAQIHRQGENSVLSSLAGAVSDAITKALEIMLEWSGSGEAEIQFELNKDFLAIVMSPQQLTALMMAWQQGGIAFDDLIWNLKRGEIVHEDRTAEDIKSERKTENPFLGEDFDQPNAEPPEQ